MSEKESLSKIQTIFYFGCSTFDIFMSSVRKMVDVYKRKDGDELKRALKQYRGHTFTDDRQFTLYNKAKDKAETTQIDFDDKRQFNMFKKMCKEYGVDILLVQRPVDLKQIIEKANEMSDNKDITLTPREKRIINTYSFSENGVYYPKKNAWVVGFSAKDLATVELVLDKMEYKVNTLARRMAKAHQYGNELRNADASLFKGDQTISRE